MSTRRPSRRPSRSFAAVAGAAAVLAGCLAIGPLFLSTAATAATRVELQGRCPGQVGANYLGPYEGHAAIVSTFGALARQVPGAAAPVVTDVSTSLALTLSPDDGVFRAATAVTRTDALAHLDLVAGSRSAAATGVYVPDWFAESHAVRVGARLALQAGPAPVSSVPVAGIYRDVIGGPHAEYWCPLEHDFQTNAFADHRPPVLIFDRRGAAAHRALFAHGQTIWELPLAAHPSAKSTAAYAAHLEPLRRAGARLGVQYRIPNVRSQVASDLGFVVTRATEIRSFTGANIAPVRWSGALTGLALVLAAALLFVRRNGREYRIRILRGTHPARLGLQAAMRTAPTVLFGAVVGTAVTAILVRGFGPSADVDSAALGSAARFTVIAVVATLAVMALTVTVGVRTFDRARRPVQRHWRWIPFELAGAVVSYVAFRHLVASGGVQLSGADLSRIDPWATFFPLLLVWTVLVALGRPVFLVLSRLRTLGAHRRPSVMLGLRRAVSDPVLSVVTSAAVAFCLATFVYASTLSTSIGGSLQAKARQNVGADVRVAMTSPPRLDAALATHATHVVRGQGSYGGQSVTVLGVDRATFSRAAFWRDSFGGSLHALLAAIAPPARGALPVVIAGDRAAPTDTTIAISQGTETAAHVVAETNLWPSMQLGQVFVIADRAALAARGIRGVDEVWVSGVPGFVPTQLASHDAGVLYTVGLSSVLDFNDALPVRWSLGLLGALGAVAGLAFAAVELAIVDSRARARQLAYLLWRRMGMRAREHWVACAVELGFPAALGAAGAIAVALFTVRVVIGHLDSLASLPPPAAFVFTARPLIIGAGVAVAVLVALVSWSQRVTGAGDPLELIRVAE